MAPGAVAVYDEVLAYPQLLADGVVMNLAVPAAQDDVGGVEGF